MTIIEHKLLKFEYPENQVVEFAKAQARVINV